MDQSTVKEDGQDRKENELYVNQDIKEKEKKSLCKGLVKKVGQEHLLVLNYRKSYTSINWTWGPFQIFQFLNNSVPKQILSLDEKYLRCCLELIFSIGAKAPSVNYFLDTGSLAENLSSLEVGHANACELVTLAASNSLAAGPENFSLSSSDDWILGTFTRSKGMINILNSSIFHQLGDISDNVKFGRTSYISGSEPAFSNYLSSPGGLSTRSPQTIQKEMVHGDHGNASEPMHKRYVSLSSTNSSYSDQSSSTSAPGNQGMLQCKWKNGFPHYVFSMDDQQQILVADLYKVDPKDGRASDYMYIFHSKPREREEHETKENESFIVGTMKVSSSFTLCPNNREMMETRFVLFGSTDYCSQEMQISRAPYQKKGFLPKKFSNASKKIYLTKHRNSSKMQSKSVVLEDSLGEPSQDPYNNRVLLNKVDLLGNHLPPNLELAAIIVKDHAYDNRVGPEAGGWGMKFLKKVGIRKNNSNLENSTTSECCTQDNGDCFKNTTVLLPAGFHGGPRTPNAGPSSLIERWRSDGHCDCGGWDMGCPLKILNIRPTGSEMLPKADMPGKCESFDLFIQGSKQGVPVMKMANIHDGLYYIHFQSTMSALESFAIAAAVVHIRDPKFQSKFCSI